MEIKIKHRYTDKIILSGKYESVKDCLQRNREADLREANLRGANLWEADLRGANLWGADLREADLREADLREADLWEADLREADLWGADLREADLREANLWGADLREADLRGADLWGADLREADLKISNILHNTKWGELSDKLTIELMRRDAIICGVDKMNKWAKNGGSCPFGSKIERDFYFAEKKALWRVGKPKLNDLELFKALCKEKEIKTSL